MRSRAVSGGCDELMVRSGAVSGSCDELSCDEWMVRSGAVSGSCDELSCDEWMVRSGAVSGGCDELMVRSGAVMSLDGEKLSGGSGGGNRKRSGGIQAKNKNPTQ